MGIFPEVLTFTSYPEKNITDCIETFGGEL